MKVFTTSIHLSPVQIWPRFGILSVETRLSGTVRSQQKNLRKHHIPFELACEVFSDPLIRYYIGQGLRTDLEKLDTDRRIAVLTDALRKHGATDATIVELLASTDTVE